MRFLTLVFFFAFLAVSSALLPNLGLPVAQKLPIRLPGDLVRQVPIVGEVADDLQVVAGEDDAAEEENDADEPAPKEEEKQNDIPKESEDNNVGGDDNADDGAEKKSSRRHHLVRLPRFVGIPRLGNKKLLGPWGRHVRI